MPKAYVLLSGGVDSSTCLAMAHALFEGSVCGIAIDYGQRHSKELDAARKIARHFDTQFMVKDLRGLIGIGGLTDTSLEIPHVSYDELPEGVSPTYVPFRNGLMLSLITSIASADPEAVAVYYGAHAEDAENDAYPDCSLPFIDHMAQAIWIGTYGRISLNAPLGTLTKASVVLTGDRLGVPWELTWSCYEGRKDHCGVCPTCRARILAFKDAAIIDPTVYTIDRSDDDDCQNYIC